MFSSPFYLKAEMGMVPVFMLLSYIIIHYPELLFFNKQEVHVRHIDQFKENATHYPILDFVGLVEEHGYTGEEHVLITPDGYILKLHRISGSPKCEKSYDKPVVFVQHGILLSSDSWVLIGPKNDLPFQLADDCKDVWVGNARGNTYSSSHVNKSMPSTEFWKFSYHEMAKYDMKTFVDYILDLTGEKDMTYIGYSMGTTISYVFLSMYPEYNQKMKNVHSLSPVVYWKHDLRRIPAQIQKNFGLIEKIIKFFGLEQLLPQTALSAKNGIMFCSDGNFTQDFCAQQVAKIGLDYKRMNKTALPTILAHFPAGTSVTNVYHYNENQYGFKAYDYGQKENMIRYGQVTPPAYDLKKVTAPVSIWYAKNDDIVNDEDVLLLKHELPNVVSYNKIDNINFNHFDFLWAQDVKELVYDKLMKTL